LNFGSGAGFLTAGSTANDTTNVDNGYSAELRIRLDKLGYKMPLNDVQVSINIFDPDGLQFKRSITLAVWNALDGQCTRFILQIVVGQ